MRFARRPMKRSDIRPEQRCVLRNVLGLDRPRGTTHAGSEAFEAAGDGFEGHTAAGPGGALSTFCRLAVVGYSLALVVSAFLLYIFGRFDNTQIAPAIHATVVLGLPATVGAGAARLILDAG